MEEEQHHYRELEINPVIVADPPEQKKMCSICLGEFLEGDEVRVMSQCILIEIDPNDHLYGPQTPM
uniref:Uncharacterized protein n=1 Tax=Solanum lycopersicum TaxID=4081 RepID=A0A3Q7HXM1_SOLLC